MLFNRFPAVLFLCFQKCYPHCLHKVRSREHLNDSIYTYENKLVVFTTMKKNIGWNNSIAVESQRDHSELGRVRDKSWEKAQILESEKLAAVLVWLATLAFVLGPNESN